MKVVLLFPPLAEPSLPYLSLPSLTAVLRRAGHEVIQRDLNLEFFDELLTPASLSAADCACRETVAELSIKSY